MKINCSKCYKDLSPDNFRKRNNDEYYKNCLDAILVYLENKFIEGMNWENYGTIWNIDHIIPVAYNNPSKYEVVKRLHYSNTQPLWALENISKGNRYIG